MPRAQSDALHAALTRAGVNSTLITLTDALHEDPVFWSEATLDRVGLFLARSVGEPSPV